MYLNDNPWYQSGTGCGPSVDAIFVIFHINVTTRQHDPNGDALDGLGVTPRINKYVHPQYVGVILFHREASIQV